MKNAVILVLLTGSLGACRNTSLEPAPTQAEDWPVDPPQAAAAPPAAPFSLTAASPQPSAEGTPTSVKHPRKTLKDWLGTLPKCRWRFGMVQAYEGEVTAERWVCEFEENHHAVFELAGREPAAWRKPGDVPSDPHAEVRLLDLNVDVSDFKAAHLKMLADMTGVAPTESQRLEVLVKKALASTGASGDVELDTMVGPGGESRLTVFHLGRTAFAANFRSPGRLK